MTRCKLLWYSIINMQMEEWHGTLGANGVEHKSCTNIPDAVPGVFNMLFVLCLTI